MLEIIKSQHDFATHKREERARRLRLIAQQIKNGTYKIKSAEVAASILREINEQK